MEDKTTSEIDVEETEKINLLSYYKETMHHCFSVGFDVSVTSVDSIPLKKADFLLGEASMWFKEFTLKREVAKKGILNRFSQHYFSFIKLCNFITYNLRN